jgi:hypothetical protein
METAEREFQGKGTAKFKGFIDYEDFHSPGIMAGASETLGDGEWTYSIFFIILRCLAISHQIKAHVLMHGPK